MSIQIQVTTEEAQGAVGALTVAVDQLRSGLRAAYDDGFRLDSAFSFADNAAAQLNELRTEFTTLRTTLRDLREEMSGFTQSGQGVVASTRAQATAMIATAQAIAQKSTALKEAKAATIALSTEQDREAESQERVTGAIRRLTPILQEAQTAAQIYANRIGDITIASSAFRAGEEKSGLSSEQTSVVIRNAAAEFEKLSAAEFAASDAGKFYMGSILLAAKAQEEMNALMQKTTVLTLEEAKAQFAASDAGKAAATALKTLAPVLQEVSTATEVYKGRIAGLVSENARFIESNGLGGISAEKLAVGLSAAKTEFIELAAAEAKAGAGALGFASEIVFADQASAAFRASLAGSGLGFGIFTGATILAATAAFAFAHTLKETVVNGAEFEASLVRGAVFAHDYATAFDAAGNSITKVGGNTALLADQAKDLATQYKFSSQEFIEGATKMEQSSVTLLETYGSMRAVANLATVSNSGLVESASNLVSISHLFNISFQESERTASQLALAMTLANTSIGSITKSLEYVGPVARQAGLDLGQTTAAIITLNKGGIESDKAGTNLRAMFQTLGKETPAATKALENFGIAANGVALKFHDFYTRDGLDFVGMLQKIKAGLDNMSTEDQIKNLTAMFRGTGNAGATFLIQSLDQLIRFNDQLKNAAVEAQKLADAMNNTTAVAFKQFGNEVKNIEQDAFSNFGSGLYSALKQLTTYLKDNATQISAALSSLLGEMLKVTQFIIEHAKAIGNLIEVYAIFKVTQILAAGAMAAYGAVVRIVAVGTAAYEAATIAATAAQSVSTIATVGLGVAAETTGVAMTVAGAAGKAAMLAIGGAMTIATVGIAALAYAVYYLHDVLTPIPLDLAHINGEMAKLDSVTKDLGKMNLDALKSLGVEETRALKNLNAEMETSQKALDKYITTQEALSGIWNMLIRANPFVLLSGYAMKAGAEWESIVKWIGNVAKQVGEDLQTIAQLIGKTVTVAKEFIDGASKAVLSLFVPEAVISSWTSLNVKINDALAGFGKYLAMQAGKAYTATDNAIFGPVSSSFDSAADAKAKAMKDGLDAGSAAVEHMNNLNLTRIIQETIKGSDAFTKLSKEIGQSKTSIEAWANKSEDVAKIAETLNNQIQKIARTFPTLASMTNLSTLSLKEFAKAAAEIKPVKLPNDNPTGPDKVKEKADEIAKDLKKVVDEYSKLNFSPDIMLHSLDEMRKITAELGVSTSAASKELQKLGITKGFAEQAVQAASAKIIFDELKIGLVAIDPVFAGLKEHVGAAAVNTDRLADATNFLNGLLAEMATSGRASSTELARMKEVIDRISPALAGLADGTTASVDAFKKLEVTAPQAFEKLIAKQGGLDDFVKSYLGLNVAITDSERLTAALAMAAQNYGSAFRDMGTETDKQNTFLQTLNTLLTVVDERTGKVAITVEQAAKAWQNYQNATPAGAIEKQNQNLANQTAIIASGSNGLAIYNTLWNATKGDLSLVTDKMKEAAVAQEHLNEQLQQVQKIHGIYTQFADDLTGVFKNVFDGIDKSFGDVTKDLKKQFTKMLEEMVLAAIKNQIMFSMGITSQGNSGGFFSAISSIFGGGSAAAPIQSAGSGGSGGMDFNSLLASTLKTNYGITPTGNGAPAASNLGGTDLISSLSSGSSPTSGGSNSGGSSSNSFMQMFDSGKSMWGLFNSGAGAAGQVAASPMWGVGTGMTSAVTAAGSSTALGAFNSLSVPYGAAGSTAGSAAGSTAASNAGGSIMPIVGGVLAGLSEFKAAGGGVAGAAGGLAYGVGTYALGTAVAAGAAAAVSGGIGAGLVAGFAAIPVVGWIALAAMAVNMISGGKLFGTSYAPTGAATTYNIGQDSGTLTSQTFESKQKPLFGGTSYRTINNTVDQKDQDQAEKMWKEVVKAGQQAQQQLGVTMTDIVSGSFKTLYDKKGKMTEQLSTVLGVVYHESIDDFQTRLKAEQVVSAVGASIAAMGGQADEANQIAKSYRANANSLADAAAAMLVAQTDIKNGTGLLQAQGAGVLTKTMDLVSELSHPGEALADTYKRLSASTILITSVFDTTGNTITKTRESFVRFSATVVDSLGGIDAASKAWGSFSQAVYTTTQQLIKPTANGNLTGALGGVGLSADTSIQDFKKAFELALPTMTDTQLANWIKAGGALGTIDNSMKALGGLAKGVDLTSLIGQQQTLVQQVNALIKAAADAGASQADLTKMEADGAKIVANQLTNFMAPITAALEKFSSNSFVSQLVAIQQQFTTNTLSATQLGASQKQLGDIQALANYQTGLLIGDLTRSVIQPLANGSISDAMAKVGLKGNVSQDDFNKKFQAALPTMSSDDLSNWVAAGSALRTVNQSMNVMSGLAKGVDLTSLIGQQATLVNQVNQLIIAAAAAGASQADLAKMEADGVKIIAAQLTNFMAPIQDQLAKLQGADFSAQLRQINQQFQANTLSATQLGASQKQLTDIQQLATTQTMLLIGQFMDQVIKPTANTNLAGSLNKIGLKADTSQSDFKAMFNDLSPSMTPEQLQSWVAAGSALNTISSSLKLMGGLAKGVDLSSVLNSQQAFVNQVNSLIAGAALAGASQAQLAKLETEGAMAIQQHLNTFMDPIEAALSKFTGRDYTYQLEQIQKQFDTNTLGAEALGASLQDLADIQALAAYQTAQVISQLQASLASAVSKLFGGLTNGASTASSAVSAASSAEAQAIQDLYTKKLDLYNAEKAAIQSIADFLKQSLVNALSPLGWQNQLSTSKSQFDAQLVAAKGGDVNAIKDIIQYAQTYLQKAQSAFGNSSDYATIYTYVTQALKGLSGQFQAAQPPVNPSAGASSSSNSSGSSSTSNSLTTDDRFGLAVQIAQQLGQLGLALNVSVFDLMKQYGVSMGTLLSAMHIDLNNIGDATVTNLKILNGSLGTKMTDLLTQLKVAPDEIGAYFKVTGAQINSGNVTGLKELAAFLGVNILTAMTYIGGNIKDMALSLGLDVKALKADSVDKLTAIAKTLGISSSDLIVALGISYKDLATSFGINIAGFNASMVTQFVLFATKLGLNVTDAAVAVGLNISTLGMSISTAIATGLQSLPNLPAGVTTGLQPYLTNIANAKTPDDLKKAYSDMNMYLSTLPANIVTMLTPLFTALGFSMTQGTGGSGAVVTQQQTTNIKLDAINSTAKDGFATMQVPLNQMSTQFNASIYGVASGINDNYNQLVQILAQLKVGNVTAAAGQQTVVQAQAAAAREQSVILANATSTAADKVFATTQQAQQAQAQQTTQTNNAGAEAARQLQARIDRLTATVALGLGQVVSKQIDTTTATKNMHNTVKNAKQDTRIK